MKIYIAVVCLLVAGFITTEADNPIDSLVKAALEVVRKLLKKYEPYPVPDMPEQTVKGDDIDLKAKFSNVKLSKAGDFTIDHIENNVLQMWAKFGVTVPTMHLEGDYTASGKVKGKSVTGNGSFKLDITNLVTTGYVEIGIVSYYVQMKTFNIDYTIQDLQFSEEGLSVEGLTPEEIKALFSSSFLKYFQDNEKFVSGQVSDYVKQQANDIMKGKTLQQLLDWLKKFIDQLI
uniref:Secreted Juvenile haemolymph binding protein-like protein n=1 Tax=Pristhesancus plagipennis TaxID=1955184 RepID=A0A2K8JS53_PRIPG|nr:secreted Juvenile haemolymph binding protein-like protein [Pristhesancus plagipennis]